MRVCGDPRRWVASARISASGAVHYGPGGVLPERWAVQQHAGGKVRTVYSPRRPGTQGRSEGCLRYSG